MPKSLMAVGTQVASFDDAEIRGSGAFDKIHLVPVGRYRDVACRHEALL